ncbi:unnamed protein product [Phytophthora lilii]|uniref:Unnamed protein product n=1 Tax=Phytophthora lilii TaxID=2077276 RepID=A0A9W6X465_9STRA|nr:unnamed protein product [Phytophthora lilii]
MSKGYKSKTLSLDEIKQKITRDIQMGSEHDNLSTTTTNLYVRQMLKLYKAGVVKHQWDPKEFIDSIQYPTKYDDAEFKRHSNKQNKAVKLDNELTPEEEAKYISYQELMSIPGKVKKILTETYGKVFLSQSEFENLPKAKRTEYLKLVFDYVTLWLNVHYPLRLVWPSVRLTGSEDANYLQGNELHLNVFKNVRLMGPQTIQMDSTTMGLIKSYLDF